MTSISSLSTNPNKECILDRITLTPPWMITADVVVTMMSTIPERCSEKLILAACVIVDIDLQVVFTIESRSSLVCDISGLLGITDHGSDSKCSREASH